MTAAGTADARTLALGVVMPGFVGATLPDWLEALLREGLGGICLFAHNIESPEQLTALTTSIYTANPSAVVSIDEEGGDVSRLHQRAGSPFPGNAVLGRIDDLEATRAVGRDVGRQLAGVGVHLNLAPDADVNCNPDNPVIGVRSFGADPAAVAAHTAAWTEGLQAVGVAACAKHFPGHGDTSTDSHVSEPVVTVDAATLAVRELAPFAAAIAAGTKTIMTSHIRVPALDPDNVATFSQAILGDLLRGRMRFEGVIVTDALDMVGASGERGIPAAAAAAVAAGSDLLCLGSNNPEHEVDAVVDALVAADVAGQLPDGRLADAADRCLALGGWAADRRHAEASQAHAATEPVVDTRRISASFALSKHAEVLLAGEPRPIRWVQIEPERNVAVGETPLGPFFEGGALPSLVVPIDDRGLADSYVAEPGVLTMVVGRELHRDAGALAATATLAAQPDVLVVDMGFAHSDHVDIATFGASRLVGEALIDLLAAPE